MDIHPKDKRTVGRRLAGLARHYVYGEKLLCDAPKPRTAEREGNAVTVAFANAGDGLKLKGGSVEALQVVQDGEKISYTAQVQGDRLILTLNAAPQKPVELRFAQEKWYRVNLYNSADIPAIPFHVDV